MGTYKLKAEHIEFLQNELPKGEIIHCHQDYIERGYTTRRWMWDCVWELPKWKRDMFFASVYQYANDSHIESVLRMVCKPHMLQDSKGYAE